MTNPNQAPNPATQPPVAEAVNQANEFIQAGEVPRLEHFAEMYATATEIAETTPGQFATASGDPLEADAAKAFLHAADPMTWMLDSKGKATNQSIYEASELSELSPKQQADVIAQKDYPRQSNNAAFERYRDRAESRLILDEELRKSQIGLDAMERAKQERKDTKETQKKELLNVEADGKIYIPKGSGAQSGRQLTEYEQAQVTAHAEQIRKGLPTILESTGVVKTDSLGRARGLDGSMLTKDQVIAVSNKQDLYRQANEGMAASLANLSPAEAAALLQLTVDRMQQLMPETTTINPATAEPKNLRERAKARMEGAWVALTKLTHGDLSGVREAATNMEKRDRRLIIGAAAASVVLAYVGHKSGAFNPMEQTLGIAPKAPSHDTSRHLTDLLSADSSQGSGKGAGTGLGAAGLNPSRVQHEAQNFSVHHLRAGENPWEVAHHTLGDNASDAKVAKLTDKILKLNHWSREQARHLKVGTGMKMPK
ncbi:MAG: hypothetical protein JWO41_119 [Candidatus Saccharibacteria bacterium]|nr:hypothetical protein [Candidatus Saccharibacteria bacterium]